MSAMSSTVATPGLTPVQLFTKSAPAATESSQARIFSSMLSNPVSMMTFSSAPWAWAICATPRMSYSTLARSPDFNAPRLITMSSSWAPKRIVASASDRLLEVSAAPKGKPMGVPSLTALARKRSAASASQCGCTKTVANPYCKAYSQWAEICAAVASGRSRVWSMTEARVLGSASSDCGLGITRVADICPDSSIAIAEKSGRGERLIGTRGKYADIGQVAVLLGKIHAVADDEFIGDGEADKIAADFRGELSTTRGNLLAGEHHAQAGILGHADTVKQRTHCPKSAVAFTMAGRRKPPMALPEFKQLCDEAKKEIREIDSAELRRMQQAHQDFALIDVREPDEVSRGTIPGAVPIPRGVLELNIDQVTTDKNKNIVLYCGGGSRSALAAQSLKKMGFKNVISLAGGYRGWSQS